MLDLSNLRNSMIIIYIWQLRTFLIIYQDTTESYTNLVLSIVYVNSNANAFIYLCMSKQTQIQNRKHITHNNVGQIKTRNE